jgi:hypothetical protein
MTRPSPALARTIAALWLFGVAFGFVEAAVVVYLRALYEPIHQKLHPDRAPGDLFPLIRLDQIEAEGPETRRRVEIELVREAATLVMLAAVGLAAARNPREGFAAFLVAFGVWDIFFYLFLKMLIDWPASLWTWDVLFLLPVPWSAPVIAPVLVAASMIGAGTFVLAREETGRPVRLGRLDWGLVFAGGLLIVVAFCWDFRNIVAGGQPNPFHWPLFILGEAVGLAGFLRGVRRGRGATDEPGVL